MNSIKKYPVSVYFILVNELCERFSFYGMRAILILYLINEHGFQEKTAFLLYHAFTCLVYFSPLIGSILADNYFGRFRVIVMGSAIYVAGLVSLSIGSVHYLEMSIRSVLDFGGLFVIALATGGIKPCVPSFAADQFDEAKQSERATFFSFFYFSINTGALFSMFLTPILRGRFQCFGSDYCFPLAFGVPSLFMFLAMTAFLMGVRFYRIQLPNKDNVIVRVFRCIFDSVCARLKGRKPVARRSHNASYRSDWLDYAPAKYSSSLVTAVRSFVNVLVILLPLPFYHALADQQGSTWVVQAREMDGNVAGVLTLLPDQMNVFNCVFVLVAILVYEFAVFPIVGKLVEVTQLRKMCVGGLIAGFAYIIGGMLQLQINKTIAPVPSPEHSFLYRVGDSNARLWTANGSLLAFGHNEWPSFHHELVDENGQNFSLTIHPGDAAVIGVYGDNDTAHLSYFRYNPTKPPNGKTRIYLSIDPESPLNSEQIFILDKNGQVVTRTQIESGAFIDILPSTFGSNEYRIAYGGRCQGQNCPFQIDFIAGMGAVHLLEVTDDYNRHLRDKNELKTLVQSNSVNILWQLPQIAVISFGEVLICVTALEFVYSQAAPTMKTVLQASWLMTFSFGNLIDMLISGTKVIKEPAVEMFFYASLMFFVMAIFIYISTQYKYVSPEDFEVDGEEERPRITWNLNPVPNEEDFNEGRGR